jgi:hypothetical protein
MDINTELERDMEGSERGLIPDKLYSAAICLEGLFTVYFIFSTQMW